MSHAEPARQHYNLTLAVLALAALAYALLQTMVAPALPEIQKDVGATTTQVTWVLTVYLLTASVATPLLGRLGDMFGKERVLVFVLIAFAAGTLVSALSHSLPWLVAGRAIQGAAGAVFPLAFGIIRDEFPREKVATGIGLISATFGIGGGAGLILSGVIVDHLSYEWIFWFGFVVIAIATVATHFFVPESPVKTPAKIDWVGAALMSGGLVCLLLGVSEGKAGAGARRACSDCSRPPSRCWWHGCSTSGACPSPWSTWACCACAASGRPTSSACCSASACSARSS